MGARRKLAPGHELDVHLEWLRRAIQDPNVNTRLVFEGILDILDALAEKAAR